MASRPRSSRPRSSRPRSSRPDPLEAAFPTASTATRRRLASLITVLDLPADTKVFTQGSSGRDIVWVCEGCLEVARDDTTLALLGPGEPCGEAAALRSSPSHLVTRSASVRTTVPTRVAVAHSRELAAIMDEFPSVAHDLYATHRARQHAA